MKPNSFLQRMFSHNREAELVERWSALEPLLGHLSKGFTVCDAGRSLLIWNAVLQY